MYQRLHYLFLVFCFIKREVCMKVSPYVEWLTLRALVKENNKQLSSKIAKECGIKSEEFSYNFRSIAENFMTFDKVAYEKYKSLPKNKTWLNHLSSDDLFCLYNYQNKILNVSHLFDIDSIAFCLINSNMNFFEKKLDFTGKPKMEKEDKKGNRPKFSEELVKEVLTNNAEKRAEVIEMYYEKKIPLDKVFDKKIGFNLGKYQNIVRSEVEKREQERQTRETMEKIKRENPYLPGFIEEIEKNNNSGNPYERELEI